MDEIFSWHRDSLQLVIEINVKAVEFIAVLDKGDASTAELIDLQLILFQLINLILFFDSSIISSYSTQMLLQNIVSTLEKLI